VPSKQWLTGGGQNEVEWLILIACFALRDGDNAPDWATQMRLARLRGILGFHGLGWSGRREGLAFLHFTEAASKATLEEIAVEGGKSVLRFKNEPARVLPENTSIENSGDYSVNEKETFKTFAPGDSITVGGEPAIIENIDVSKEGNLRGRIYLTIEIGDHEAGEPIVSVDPCLRRGWLIAWAGVARENTAGYHVGGNPVPCASLVHTDAVSDRLAGTWQDADFSDYGELRYEAVEHEPYVWSVINRILSGG